jgi:anti-sigma factor RsiW
MNPCDKIREALPALLYGDLPPAEETAVRQHLTDCPACRAEHAALRQVRGLLDAAPPPAVKVDLPRLYQEAARRQERQLRHWRRLACVALAAAAVLLLVFGLKLEVRLEQHQLVLRWGAPPPVPAPLVVVPQEPPPASAAEVRVVRDLLHLLAADVEERDRQMRQGLADMAGRLDSLQGQTQQRWASAQRDLNGLYALFTAQSGPREKGE